MKTRQKLLIELHRDKKAITDTSDLADWLVCFHDHLDIPRVSMWKRGELNAGLATIDFDLTGCGDLECVTEGDYSLEEAKPVLVKWLEEKFI